MARKTYQKKITSKEILSKMNPKNKRLMERFLKYKNAKCSDGTIEGYRSDLNIFFTYNYLYNDDKFFINIKKIELAEFFDYGLTELRWGGNRYARMRSLLKSFSDFICDFLDEDYPDFKNLVDKAVDKIPKEPVRKKTVVTEKEVYELRDMLIEMGLVQQACFLMLLAASGARVSESLRIGVNLIDENHDVFEGMFLETTEEIKTKGHGKKGTMMTRYIIKDVFLPTYYMWLKEREAILKKTGKETNAMFIKSTGEPISVEGVKAWVRKWGELTGIDFYPHCFRHFIVSDLTRKGCSSDFIVAVMKWKSADMYKIYNDIEDKDIKWKDIEKLRDAFKK